MVPTTVDWLNTIGEWNSNEQLKETTAIYVMWWTGRETMPPIVNICFKNLCRNAKKHPVILITQENIFSLFPQLTALIKETLEMYENGKICIQHFSDIIRSLILNKIGGIWIDATVYVAQDWDKNIIGKMFYSGRRTAAYASSGKSITNGQWTSYFIASVKGNPLLRFFHEGLFECYKRKGKIEEYYTMDYLFAIGMKESSVIRQIITSVPMIDANLFGLESLMHEPYEKEEYDAFIATAPFFKLNHRIDYARFDSGGNQTVFDFMSHLST